MDFQKAEVITWLGTVFGGIVFVAVIGYFTERCEAHEQRTVAACLQKHPPLECKLIELRMTE